MTTANAPVERRILEALADGRPRASRDIAMVLAGNGGNYIALQQASRSVRDALPRLRQHEQVRRLVYGMPGPAGQTVYSERFVAWDAVVAVCVGCWNRWWGLDKPPPRIEGEVRDTCFMCSQPAKDGIFASRAEALERQRAQERDAEPAVVRGEVTLRGMLEHFLTHDPLRKDAGLNDEDLAADAATVAQEFAGAYEDAVANDLMTARETARATVQRLAALQERYDREHETWKTDKDRLNAFLASFGMTDAEAMTTDACAHVGDRIAFATCGVCGAEWIHTATGIPPSMTTCGHDQIEVAWFRREAPTD